MKNCFFNQIQKPYHSENNPKILNVIYFLHFSHYDITGFSGKGANINKLTLFHLFKDR